MKLYDCKFLVNDLYFIDNYVNKYINFLYLISYVYF